jgi:hypothetical protein
MGNTPTLTLTDETFHSSHEAAKLVVLKWSAPSAQFDPDWSIPTATSSCALTSLGCSRSCDTAVCSRSGSKAESSIWRRAPTTAFALSVGSSARSRAVQRIYRSAALSAFAIREQWSAISPMAI